jgi:CDP-alcohol phosphatidyltransferase-like enzyme
MTSQSGLWFKAYEIEELADVYFFRRLGVLVAYTARTLRMTPTQLSIIAAVIGIAGGSLLYDARFGLLAFALLIIHGVLDSADGQLARMTDQVSELGRIFDGIAGYVTHTAVYVAIVARFLGGGRMSIIVWAILAALANAVQAQMYDYHRTAYADIAIKGVAPTVSGRTVDAVWARWLLRAYESVQRRLVGLHEGVEAAVVARASGTEGGIRLVRGRDRALYRECFYWPVRGWNLLGDNPRRYVIGILAWTQHLDWFFGFVLVPMNAALGLLWMWQARADRRFLSALGTER